jgi:hypothetical protein
MKSQARHAPGNLQPLGCGGMVTIMQALCLRRIARSDTPALF